MLYVPLTSPSLNITKPTIKNTIYVLLLADLSILLLIPPLLGMQLLILVSLSVSYFQVRI
jgi:hypothetical protein